MTQAVCPPVPTEAELRNSGNYVRINPVDVVLGEFLVMEYLGVISCIEITYLHRQDGTNIVTQFTFRSTEGRNYSMTIDYFNNNGGMLYRRNPYAERLDKFIEGKNIPSDIRNKVLTDYLRGGRRKRRGTKRRTRKNKRKSTRRIRRK
jgi:hypothetical protein